ncbi:MAG: hypothetical protein Q8M76_03140 [Spirochaetaceae bacterium]|nr:hypothetical protein [Spirochaetaceae bacterium]
MKRTVLVLVLLAVAAASLAADTSDFYPLYVDVIKVYSHADGYRVVYRRGSMDIADVYLPIALFKTTEQDGERLPSRATLVRGDGPTLPYMTVFYKEGKFDHLRLYVQKDFRDPSWAVLSPADGDGKFTEEALDIVIKF